MIGTEILPYVPSIVFTFKIKVILIHVEVYKLILLTAYVLDNKIKSFLKDNGSHIEEYLYDYLQFINSSWKLRR